MKKTKFTETQIVKAIKEHEGGRRAEDICRELGYPQYLFTSGNNVMGVWKSKNSNVLKSWRMRTPD